jgi:hypothetical protein
MVLVGTDGIDHRELVKATEKTFWTLPEFRSHQTRTARSHKAGLYQFGGATLPLNLLATGLYIAKSRCGLAIESERAIIFLIHHTFVNDPPLPANSNLRV